MSCGTNVVEPDAIDLSDLGLTDQRQFRTHYLGLGLEVLAYTAAGTNRHPNEDAFWVSEFGGEQLSVGVFDEASQKFGLQSGQALREVVSYCAALEPLEPPWNQIHDLQAYLQSFLKQQRARAGVCVCLVTIRKGGYFEWASLGDCGLLRLTPDIENSYKVKRINSAQSIGKQLLAALGIDSNQPVQAGSGCLELGEILLTGSDGFMNETIERQPLTMVDGLPAWLRSAREQQDGDDDISVVAIERVG
jgi:Stage II sporulation protein E (SpoIIE)